MSFPTPQGAVLPGLGPGIVGNERMGGVGVTQGGEIARRLGFQGTSTGLEEGRRGRVEADNPLPAGKARDLSHVLGQRF